MTCFLRLIEAEGVGDIELLDRLIDIFAPVVRLRGSPEHRDEFKVRLEPIRAPGVIPGAEQRIKSSVKE